MNDLQHPNEYIRGSTLRFLCKIKEAEILEPLVPSVRACLVNIQYYYFFAYFFLTNLYLVFFFVGASSFLCKKECCICHWCYFQVL